MSATNRTEDLNVKVYEEASSCTIGDTCEHDMPADSMSTSISSRPSSFSEGALFLPELETELLSFPQGHHDDQVDSISQALSYKVEGYDGSLAGSPGSKQLHQAALSAA